MADQVPSSVGKRYRVIVNPVVIEEEIEGGGIRPFTTIKGVTYFDCSLTVVNLLQGKLLAFFQELVAMSEEVRKSNEK
jgi:hypothetical protein